MNIESSAPMGAGHKAVKEAFESVYSCISITCEDIGGLLESEGKYYEGAEPCTAAAPDDGTASHALRKEAPLFFGALSLMALHFALIN